MLYQLRVLGFVFVVSTVIAISVSAQEATVPLAQIQQWYGTFTADDPEPSLYTTYTLTIDPYYLSQRFDGTLEVAGRMTHYKIPVRGYLVPDGDHLQVVCFGNTLEGSAPWDSGHRARPDVNTPIFTLEVKDGKLVTKLGTYPGAPAGLSFEKKK